MKRVFLYLFALSICACSGGGFSDAERDIIGQSGDGIMPLKVVTNHDDSLFLRRQARPLLEAHLMSSEFEVLRERMLATVTNPQNEGVGIAAPQVGLDYALVAVQRFDKEGEPFEFYANPTIGWRSESMSAGGEGCLSVPELYGEVMRNDTIDVVYVHPTTRMPVTERVAGFTAVIFQHEIDHLVGTLYTDRAHTITRE